MRVQVPSGCLGGALWFCLGAYLHLLGQGSRELQKVMGMGLRRFLGRQVVRQ
jgi:hypothetical protein